ncbi:hypothetical protein AAFF_G00015120 [Aldrovandia affinis]|uniref:Uncharacterized protein n=1 Tax=Aldrovandia affinis TaxID=143900 RepID=A0AAD7WHW9_9TELE|nr:hypothetical protein AAFF_G00015120 [Aldrovandia affinis]
MGITGPTVITDLPLPPDCVGVLRTHSGPTVDSSLHITLFKAHSSIRFFVLPCNATHLQNRDRNPTNRLREVKGHIQGVEEVEGQLLSETRKLYSGACQAAGRSLSQRCRATSTSPLRSNLEPAPDLRVGAGQSGFSAGIRSAASTFRTFGPQGPPAPAPSPGPPPCSQAP